MYNEAAQSGLNLEEFSESILSWMRSGVKEDWEASGKEERGTEKVIRL